MPRKKKEAAPPFVVNSRGYTISDRKYPRVTSILNALAKPALVPWAAKTVAQFAWDARHAWGHLPEEDAVKLLKRAPDAIKEQAAEKGTVVHNLLEDLFLGRPGKEELTEQEVAMYGAGLQFVEDYQPEALWGVEVTTYSPIRNHAGTCDLPCRLKRGWNGEGIYLLDWKTSKSVHAEYALQLTAYAVAERCFLAGVDSETPWLNQVVGMGVVHLTTEGYVLHKVCTPMEDLVQAWDALRSVHSWLQIGDDHLSIVEALTQGELCSTEREDISTSETSDPLSQTVLSLPL